MKLSYIFFFRLGFFSGKLVVKKRRRNRKVMSNAINAAESIAGMKAFEKLLHGTKLGKFDEETGGAVSAIGMSLVMDTLPDGITMFSDLLHGNISKFETDATKFGDMFGHLSFWENLGKQSGWQYLQMLSFKALKKAAEKAVSQYSRSGEGAAEDAAEDAAEGAAGEGAAEGAAEGAGEAAGEAAGDAGDEMADVAEEIAEEIADMLGEEVGEEVGMEIAVSVATEVVSAATEAAAGLATELAVDGTVAAAAPVGTIIAGLLFAIQSVGMVLDISDVQGYNETMTVKSLAKLSVAFETNFKKAVTLSFKNAIIKELAGQSPSARAQLKPLLENALQFPLEQVPFGSHYPALGTPVSAGGNAQLNAEFEAYVKEYVSGKQITPVPPGVSKTTSYPLPAADVAPPLPPSFSQWVAKAMTPLKTVVPASIVDEYPVATAVVAVGAVSLLAHLLLKRRKKSSKKSESTKFN